MIISITGSPGTGKTSVGKLLAERFGYNFYSVGDLRGKMALEKGVTIDELNALGEKDPSSDLSVDNYQRELGNKEDNFVIEGRLSWHFIPPSFKVYLTCHLDVAAERIFHARKHDMEGRADEAVYTSVKEARDAITHRIASDVVRYQKYYGLDYRDPSHYDLVVDTTDIQGVPAVADVVEAAIKNGHMLQTPSSTT
jgi:CMP/dCMP kinase